MIVVKKKWYLGIFILCCEQAIKKYAATSYRVAQKQIVNQMPPSPCFPKIIKTRSVDFGQQDDFNCFIKG